MSITNAGAISQANVQLSVAPLGFYIIEDSNDTTKVYGEIVHQMIDSYNSNNRVIYVTPPDRVYKLSQVNATQITSLGKIGFGNSIINGTDGYLYYIGLLQTVQRTIDGFAPDPVSYPGQRALGGIIELLPPLIARIQLALQITTNVGVNLSEISNNISATIIGYVNGLGFQEIPSFYLK